MVDPRRPVSTGWRDGYQPMVAEVEVVWLC
jgi:hypothetical protein